MISRISLTAAAILALSVAMPASAKIATGSNVSDMTVTDSNGCLLYISPSPRDRQKSRMPSSA